MQNGLKRQSFLSDCDIVIFILYRIGNQLSFCYTSRMKLPEKKLNVKLIAFDLDDTLLTDERIISPKTLRLIQKAAEQGITIVLCSGRAENGILPYVRILNIAGRQEGRYLIAFNGASVFDLHRRIPIYTNSVDTSILKYVYNEARSRGMPSIVYDQSTIFSWEDSEWARMDAKLCNLNFKVVDDFELFLESSFPKMLVPSDPAKVTELKEFLSNKLAGKADIFISKPYFLEVMSHGVGKGPSILWLAEELGIPKEQTMAFGDSMNDESMLRHCEYGVAMSNGLDYIKDICSFVTRYDNNNDGIGDFLENFVLA